MSSLYDHNFIYLIHCTSLVTATKYLTLTAEKKAGLRTACPCDQMKPPCIVVSSIAHFTRQPGVQL